MRLFLLISTKFNLILESDRIKMSNKRYQYIIKTQFLGFRYSGWQKQPGQRTIEGMLLKTLKFILPQSTVKILGAGRTDAKVSAKEAAFELFTDTEITNTSDFIQLFNANLPADIRIVSCETTDVDFNIIQDIRLKEYHYYFSFGSKNHPFCAPFMANILDVLDIELMKKAAVLFVGTHDYKSYTVRHKKNAKFKRSIISCALELNTELTASFFPEKSYVLKVSGKGFMRYQIRMMMGALIKLGRGELNLEDIKASLYEDSRLTLNYVAPGSGLILHRTSLN